MKKYIAVLMDEDPDDGVRTFDSVHTDAREAVVKFLADRNRREIHIVRDGGGLFDEQGNFTPGAMMVEPYGSDRVEVSRYNPDSLGHVVLADADVIVATLSSLAAEGERSEP